ncbi:MAG: MBL fold metallo-hydrolase [Dehalococcoidia bacterium]|nr:MBL fold metallo-hydrolase [Dehalococcoidia bacterium]
MEILPGIHQLKLPFPLQLDQLAVNAYLIQGDKGWLLIDTGWNTSQAFAAMERQLAEIGLTFRNISLILITHFHPDHYGLAGRLVQSSGARVALHRIEKDFIDSRYMHMDGLLDETAAILRANGVPEKDLPRLQKASLGVRQYVAPVSPEVMLNGGETINQGPFQFEVIWTPGHSPGHVCLLERHRRILISGDHVLPATFSNVGLHSQSGPDPLPNYLRSLRAMDQLDVDLVLPAHEHVFSGLRPRVQEILHHHEERKKAIMAVLREGPRTAYDISLRIPWIVNGVTMTFDQLQALDRRLAVMSAMAHLEPLCNEGIAQKMQRDGVVFYSLAGGQ